MPPWDHGVEFGGSGAVAAGAGNGNALFAETVRLQGALLCARHVLALGAGIFVAC